MVEPAIPPGFPPVAELAVPPVAEPPIPPGMPAPEPPVPPASEPEFPPAAVEGFPAGVGSGFGPVAEAEVPAGVGSGSACGVLWAAVLSPESGFAPGARGSGSLGAQPGLFRFGCGSSLIVLPCSCFASYVHFRTASYALRPLRASFAPLTEDSRTGRSVPGSRHAPRTPPCAPFVLSAPPENPWHTDPDAE
ncbi:hypothetical protein GCM10017771_43160 [Streptomyces capitiformicae]|uniref:Uncharacterized protein n=1 Tax=Streptomyces capitiformicae TaxID=2014920 RepID=A0A918YXE8_9ACTN|nr:hypothetical protein GCM10017771_43160 [Streptomyces capitiformicae]